MVISRRGNPVNEPYAIAGKLAIDADSTGSFTGQITAGNDENGIALASIRTYGTQLVPDMTAPTVYKVYGQITGRSFSIAIAVDEANDKYVYGTGVTKYDIRDVMSGKVDFIHAAGGSAVGPEIGDQGDWEAAMSTPPAPGTPPDSYTTMIVCTKVVLFGYTLYESCTTVTTQKGTLQ